MNLDAIRRDERGNVDPKTAADCVAHCTAFMTCDDVEMAVLLIDILVQKRVGAAVIETVKACCESANRVIAKSI